MEISRTYAREGSRLSSPRSIARWGTALAASAALAASFAQSATAADAGDGTLTWGVKQSFRNYVGSPIAQGTITAGDGATQVDSGEFEFSSGTGTVEDDGSAEVSFSGSVHFEGHHGELDVTLANPTLTLDADGSGALTVDHSTPEGSQEVTIADITDAELDVSGDTATLEEAGATLAADGVDVFSYMGSPFYSEGDELDPVSAEISLEDDSDDGSGDGGGDDGSDDDNGSDDGSGADDGTGDDSGSDDPGTDDDGADAGSGDDATDDAGDGDDEAPVTGPVIETDVV